MSEPENDEFVDVPEPPRVMEESPAILVQRHGLLWIHYSYLSAAALKLTHGGDMMLKLTRPQTTPMVMRADNWKKDLILAAMVQARNAGMVSQKSTFVMLPDGTNERYAK